MVISITKKMEENNNEIFVHIGLGKAGTTALRSNVFPELCKITELKYWGDNPSLVKEIDRHRIKMRLGLDVEKIQVPNKTLISYVSLVSNPLWDPVVDEEFAEKNLIAFGKNAHIIITIREPRSYLTSVYLQSLHEGEIQKPEHFFLSDKYYSRNYENYKFKIDDFSYEQVINFYKNRFCNVTVIKYEQLLNLNFLQELFSINDKQLELLQIAFKKMNFNRGFSARAVRYTLSLEKFLNNTFNFKISKGITNEMFVKALVGNNDMKKEGIFKRISNNISKELKWRYFIQNRLDKILPYQKFQLDFNKLSYIDINKLEKEYNKLPNMITYKNENK